MRDVKSGTSKGSQLPSPYVWGAICPRTWCRPRPYQGLSLRNPFSRRIKVYERDLLRGIIYKMSLELKIFDQVIVINSINLGFPFSDRTWTMIKASSLIGGTYLN